MEFVRVWLMMGWRRFCIELNWMKAGFQLLQLCGGPNDGNFAAPCVLSVRVITSAVAQGFLVASNAPKGTVFSPDSYKIFLPAVLEQRVNCAHMRM